MVNNLELWVTCVWISLTGLAEVEEGEVDGHKIRLLSHIVGRISFGSEPQVLKVGALLSPSFPGWDASL